MLVCLMGFEFVEVHLDLFGFHKVHVNHLFGFIFLSIKIGS